MPAIVITSNREQELPTAFKGRCIYHYISFPEPDLMRDILAKHFTQVEEEVIQKAMDLFYQMRKLGLERAPSTRELLNWLKYLNRFPKEEALSKIDEKEGLGALIKTQADLKKVIQRMR
jgi:MoxR-like ATPase